MNDIFDKLNRLDDNKLIDIVKNYRQYNYSTDIRNSTIEILENRGVKINTLKEQGNFENRSYDDAETHYKSFEKNSILAFTFYGVILVLKIITPLAISKNSEITLMVTVIMFWGALIGYFITLIKSFISQSKYYSLIGKKDNQLNPGLYFSVGLLFYAAAYFVFRKQVKDDINLIR